MKTKARGVKSILHNILFGLAGFAALAPKANAQEMFGQGVFIETVEGFPVDQLVAFKATETQQYLNNQRCGAVAWEWDFGDGTPKVRRIGSRIYDHGGPANGGPVIALGEQWENSDVYHKYPGTGGYVVTVKVTDACGNVTTAKTTAAPIFQTHDRISLVRRSASEYYVNIDPANMGDPLVTKTLTVQRVYGDQYGEHTPYVCGSTFNPCDLTKPINLVDESTGTILPGTYVFLSNSLGSDMYRQDFFENGFVPSTPHRNDNRSGTRLELTVGEPNARCRDTDGGRNLGMHGTVYLENTPFSDDCQQFSVESDLYEYSCTANNHVVREIVPCEYGCSAGACLPKPKTK